MADHIFLREEISQSDLQIDEQAGLIRNVKILGFTSQNGRIYLPEAVRAALPRYEGLRVNLDHPNKPTDRRSVKDRIGKLTEVHEATDGLRGNLNYNPAHPYGPAIAWAAKHQPDTLGLSHNAIGAGKHDASGTFIVNKIVAVKSVDLVADPATTKGLYEDMEPDLDMERDDTGADDAGDFETKIGELIVSILHDEDLDKAAKRKKILAALNLMDEEGEEKEPEEEAEGDDEEPEKKDDEEEEAVDPKVELARLKAEKQARKLCEAAKLPAGSITEVFVESLAAVKSEKKMRQLIEDRKRVVNKPRSAAAGSAPAVSAEEFAAKLRS